MFTPDSRFAHDSYLVRRQVFKLLGGAFHVYHASGELAFYSRMKAFRLKQDIRLFADLQMQTEVLRIQARQALDFSAAYDVVDSVTGQVVGALKRKGLKSMVRDEWAVMDSSDREIGLVQEESMAGALLSRFIHLVPQRYECRIGDTLVSTFRQRFNPFVYKLAVDFVPGLEGIFDRRLGLAMALLLAAVEGRQE